MRDGIIEKSRDLLKQNHIKFHIDDDYDADGVYDMLENAETSFPLLKVSRSTKFLKRRESHMENTFLPPSML